MQNINAFYEAFEKSMSMYEAVADGTKEQQHYGKILNANFHSLQTMLVILACERCNEDHVNVMIGEKR